MPTFRCEADRDLPIDEDRAWDGDAAKARVFEWAGWPDDPMPAKARRAFLAYDSEAPELKGSYKLPFADVVDGRLVAIAAGLRNAASRLPQTDGLSDEVRDACRAVLDAYFARMEEEGEGEESRGRPAVYASPARVLARTNVAELLTLAKEERALDPSIFDEREPYFWAAEISSDRLDSYFTRMARSSLQNYAAEAATGVAFQNSHRWTELPFGQSLTGVFTRAHGERPARVTAEFYTLRGLTLNGVSTDELIAGMRAGIVRDVSIGFYGGSFRCSICGRDYWDWDCPHVPGVEYDLTDKDGQPTGERALAFFWVEDAHLAEVSAVFDGATPGAAIQKAHREAETGRLRPEAARLLEARYRIRLGPGGRALSEGGRSPGMGRRPIVAPASGRPTPGSTEEGAMDLTAMLSRLGAPDGADASWLEAEIVRLRPLAGDGRAYRADLVTAALAEGVRAHGNAFAVETYRAMLEAADLAVIKRMRDDWAASAVRALPGGRLSHDEGDPAPAASGTTGERELPAAAYRV